MSHLHPWVVANSVALVMLALVFAYLFSAIRRSSLAWWAAGFAAGGVGQFVSGWEMIHGASTPGGLVAALFAGIMGVSFLQANYLYLQRPVPRAWWGVWIASVAWVPVVLVLGLRGPVTITPLLLLVAATLIVAGALVVMSTPRRVSAWMAGGGQVLLGLHIVDYPILSQFPETHPWAYLAAVALNTSVAIGLIMRHFEEAHEELARTTRQLADARRIEAIGRLAGGVAHDFNNLLTVILTSVEIAEQEHDTNPEVAETYASIRDAAERAARLTTQLLALGRRTVLRPEPFELTRALADVVEMLRRVTPENIDLRLTNVDEPLTVLLDRTGVEQLVMNLVANARDAMPSGGTLDVRLTVDPDDDGQIILEVADTGVGMDEPTSTQVFDAFFTTKERGQGTGLGLATVHGIVTQMGGRISLRSAPDQGTNVEVCLPAPRVEIEQKQKPTKSAPALQTARILVVEDENGVRVVAERILVAAGHEVATASDGAVALALIQGGERFDLVVSDVVMPNLGGVELSQQLAKIAPDLPVLLVSGHVFQEGVATGVNEDVPFLAKPYSRRGLIEAVENALPPRQKKAGLTARARH